MKKTDKISYYETHPNIGKVRVDYDLVTLNEPYIPYHYDFGNHKGFIRYARIMAVKDKVDHKIFLYLQPTPRDVDLEARRAADNKAHREMRKEETMHGPVYITVENQVK